VAAGVVPVADASDGGGSIRIPASCCGLVGLKPSRGRMRDFGRGDPPPVDIAVVGCVSRSVRDTATWLASAERTGRNQVYAPVGVVAGPNQRRLRVGLAIKDTMGRDPDPQVRAAIEDVAELCRSLRHEVREFRPPIDGEAFAQAFTLYWASDAAQTTADLRRAHPNRPITELLEPLTLALDETYRRAPRGALNGAIETLRRSDSQYAEMFSGIDVLLTPVLARPPARIGDYAPTRPEAFATIGDYVAYTPLQNAAGAPAIALPLSMSTDNLPIGAHFSAAKGEERTLLELAYELEFARPWAARKPPVWAG
jgi:amidase